MDNKITCANCDDQEWVCENHPEVPWGQGEGCCGGAGSPCSCIYDYERQEFRDIFGGKNILSGLNARVEG